MNQLSTALALLGSAKRPIVLTGAGMSADSGIPTFRGPQGGLWSEYAPEQLATPAAFDADSALVWGWYVWRMALVQQARPHAGHLALAQMQDRWPELTIVTQNVDNLHERAGSRQVLHLHGDLFVHRCSVCGRERSGFEVPGDAALNPRLRLAPPLCRHCNGPIRPGVVWFGEPLPLEAEWKAKRRIGDADVLLLIGTSGVVEPAASLVRHGKYCGARVIEINPEESRLTPMADVHVRSSAADALRHITIKKEQ